MDFYFFIFEGERPNRIPSCPAIDLRYPDIRITVCFNGLFIGPTRTYKEEKKEAETVVEEEAETVVEEAAAAEDKRSKGKGKDKNKDN